VLGLVSSKGLPFEGTILALLPLDNPAAREVLARQLAAAAPLESQWMRARLAERGIDLAPIPSDPNATRWSKPRWRLTYAQRTEYRAEEAAALARLGITLP
jgi:hypothetical protein